MKKIFGFTEYSDDWIWIVVSKITYVGPVSPSSFERREKYPFSFYMGTDSGEKALAFYKTEADADESHDILLDILEEKEEITE